MPALWLAALYFQGWVPPVIGLIWCVGRVLFALGYKAIKPSARAPGFALTILSTLVLVILGGIGIVMAWMAATAV
jgi:uncharacterized membrane protein YecN with MAPEG domain